MTRRHSLRSPGRAILLALALSPLTLAGSARMAVAAVDYKDWVLPKSFPPVTEGEKALKAVPFAAGAPAVVLFNGSQRDWAGVNLVRQTKFRRVKILTQAGVENASDYTLNLLGDWRVQKVEARTILPDGTIVDAAENIHREKSDDDDKSDRIEVVRIKFPRVEIGAILDVFILLHADSVAVEPWDVQERLPVMESRFVLIPPNGLPFRTAVSHMPPEAAVAKSFRFGETHGHAWSFKDVPPIPDLPNMPADGDVARTLLIIYGQPASNPTAEWKAFIRRWTDYWDQWLRKEHGSCDALAKQVAGAAATPREKADAIGKALRARLTNTGSRDFAWATSPDAVLEKGRGSSADIAGLAVAMLHAVGVDARLAATRSRESGSLPTNMPVASLLDDVLVAIPEGSGATTTNLFFSPSADLAIGQLPWHLSAVMAIVLDKDSTGPVQVPVPTADRNRTSRQVQVSVDPQGTLSAQAVTTRTGSSAERWRAKLKDLSADERKASVAEQLRVRMPSAVIDALAVDGLDAAAEELVVTLSVTAPGYATRAGQRLLVKPFVFPDIDPADWSAATRDVDIDLGDPYLDEESVVMKLPDGTASARHPAPATMNAGETGSYETSFEGKGKIILCKRKVRINTSRFLAANWEPLRKWFLGMAENDEQPIVLEMREGQ